MANVDAHAAGTPSWADLMTPDPEKARAFYAAVFGWTFDVGGPDTGHYAMCEVGGRDVAGIGQLPKDAPYPTAWSVYFATDDVDASVKEVERLGGKVMMPPMDVMESGRMAFAFDPSGAAFGFWQPKQHKGYQVEGVHGAPAWFECHTRDAEKARDFYARLMKQEPKKMEGMEYWTFHRGPTVAFGMQQMGAEIPAQIPAHWLVYFRVDSTDAATAKLGELGGKVMMPAFDTPYGRMAVVSDPFGAAFAVIEAPKG